MALDIRRPVHCGRTLLLNPPILAKAPAAVSIKFLLSICFFAALWLIPWQTGYCQVKPPEPKARMYRAPDGKLYVPGSLPVSLSFSAGGDTQKAPAPAWTFDKEGKQLLTARGQSTPAIEIYVDLTPPKTQITFTGSPQYQAEDLMYYGKGVVFNASASDALSGVNTIFISVNGLPYLPFGGQYRQFTANAENTVNVLSIDNVGNRETKNTVSFFLDATAPQSTIKITGHIYKIKSNIENNIDNISDNISILSPSTAIALSASDSAAGLEAIYYRMDDGPEKKYRKPLQVKSMKPGKHCLTWYARDKVNNRETPHRFPFEYDNEPPRVSLEVEGPVHRQEGAVFISGLSRLKSIAKDNRAGTASIHYRIDSGKNVLYTEPFQLPHQSGRHKVEALAADNVANQSAPLSRHYYLDLSPPESDFKISGFYNRTDNEFIIRKDVSLQLIAADLESGVKVIRYRIGGQPAMTYSTPLNWQKDGRYLLRYWAEDNVGNIESIKTLNLRVENTPAKTGFRKPAARYPKQWYQHPDGRLMGSTGLPFFLYIGLSGKDGKTIGQPILLDLEKLASINDNTGNDKAITFAKGGINTLTIQTGSSGKRGGQSFQVLIDALPPRTSISFSSPRRCAANKLPCYGPGLEIRFSAADVKQGIVSGFKETRVSVDGSEFFSYSTPLRIFSRQKTYNLEYFSVDNVGNAEKTRTASFTVDATPPVTTRQISGPRSGPIFSSRTMITLEADDNHSGVKSTYYSFDGKKERLYGGPLTRKVLSGLSQGKHTLRYYSIDRTGNKEYPRNMNFTLDHGSPSVLLKVRGEQHRSGKILYLAQGSKILFSAADPASGLKSIHYRVDNGGQEQYKKPLVAPQVTRRYYLYYNAEDNAGNILSWQQQVVVVDNTPPQTRLTYDGAVFRDKYRFYAGSQTRMVLSANDAQSGVRHILCSVDNLPFKPVAAPFNIKRRGSHRLRFRAVDNVGNVEKLSRKDIYIDNTPPVLNISYNLRSFRSTPEKIPVYPSGLVISITASDSITEVDKIVYRIDNGGEHLYRNPLSEFARGRNISLTVTATDRLGNRAENTTIFQVEKGER